jgi:hypothetical protein
MNNSASPQVEFRPVEELDFPTLAAWLAQPHVGKFYQKTPITLAEVPSSTAPSFEVRSRILLRLKG